MNYSVQNLSKNKIEIAFDIDKAEWDIIIAEAYTKNKHKYSLEGFRKGKVPRNVLENRFGKEVFFEDALDMALTKYYGEILDKEKELEPIDRPEVDVKEVSEDGVKAVITVTIKPQFTLGQYKGLTLAKTEIKVSDENVEEQIKNALETQARWIDITDRAVANGDKITLDYSGSVDGVKFDGGTAENQNLEIGSNTFIPGFEAQLVGAIIGETKDIVVTFPAEYGAKDLAGKDATFTVTVKDIKVKELPAIDDNFAKDVSEFDTLVEYKASILDKLTKSAEAQAKFQDENKLIDTITDNTEIDVPEVMIQEELDHMMQELEYRMQSQGIKLEDYLKYANIKLEDVRADKQADAIRAVKSRLVLEAILKAEDIKLSTEEIDAKIVSIAAASSKTAEEYKQTLQQEQFNRIINDMLTDKLFTMLSEVNTLA